MFPKMGAIAMISVLAGTIGGVGASFLVGMPSHAQQANEIVRAQQFELVDAQGRVRGKIGFSADAQPYIQLHDESNMGGVWIGISRDTGLAVSDLDGRTRLVLSVNERGNPSLVVRDRDHNTRSFQPDR